MTSHLRATRRHLPHGITQCYLPPDTSELAPPTPSQTGRLVLELPTPEGWKAEWACRQWSDKGPAQNVSVLSLCFEFQIQSKNIKQHHRNKRNKLTLTREKLVLTGPADRSRQNVAVGFLSSVLATKRRRRLRLQRQCGRAIRSL